METPKYIPYPKHIEHKPETPITRCFDPYNHETIDDIKDYIISLGLITGNELDGDNGLINRIRRLSFYDANDQVFGILRGSIHKPVTLPILQFYSTSYIYYDIDDVRYIIHGHSLYRTHDKKGYRITHGCNSIEDMVISSHRPSKVTIVIEHDQQHDYSNEVVSSATDMDGYCSVTICACNGTKIDYRSGYDRDHTYIDAFGRRFYVSGWSKGVIEYTSMDNIDELMLYLDRYMNYRLFRSYMYSLENDIKSHDESSVDVVYSKYSIQSIHDLNDKREKLKEMTNVYSRLLPHVMNIKYRTLMVRNAIPEEYKNIPVKIKDRRWKGSTKKTHSLYGLIERIHEEALYHGSIYESSDRSNIIHRDGKYYLNSYNWTASQCRNVNVSNIEIDSMNIMKHVSESLLDFHNKYCNHPMYHDYCATMRNYLHGV